MKELYIDFDGVILDTITKPYEELRNLKISKEEEVTLFYSKLDWKKLLEESEEINDSLACIQKLIDSKKFYISILTHFVSIHEIEQKIKYIRKHFSDITIIPVPKFVSKTKMVHTEGAILVDDYDINLKEWKQEGGISIKFSPKLKDKGFIVINKLDQILELEI